MFMYIDFKRINPTVEYYYIILFNICDNFVCKTYLCIILCCISVCIVNITSLSFMHLTSLVYIILYIFSSTIHRDLEQAKKRVETERLKR